MFHGAGQLKNIKSFLLLIKYIYVKFEWSDSNLYCYVFSPVAVSCLVCPFMSLYTSNFIVIKAVHNTINDVIMSPSVPALFKIYMAAVKKMAVSQP